MDGYTDENNFAIELLALFGFKFMDLKQDIREKIGKIDADLIYKYVRPAHQNLVLSCYREIKNEKDIDGVKKESQK